MYKKLNLIKYFSSLDRLSNLLSTIYSIVMAKRKKYFTFISRFKGVITSVLVIAAVLTFSAVVRAHGGDSSLHHACIGTVNGRVTIVGVNDECGANETAMDWIKNVFAGSGLTIIRDENGATLSADLTYVQKRVSSTCTTGSAIKAIGSDGTVTCETIVPLAGTKAYQVNATDGQTTSSGSYSDMTNGTQQIVLSQKSIVQVIANANAYNSSGSYAAYIRVTYDSGGSDTEIGTQGYTNVTSDSQSITAGGVVTLNSGTYTIALQKKIYPNPSGTATFYQPSMSIVVIPTE